MSKRAYRATRVNDVNWDQLAQGKDGGSCRVTGASGWPSPTKQGRLSTSSPCPALGCESGWAGPPRAWTPPPPLTRHEPGWFGHYVGCRRGQVQPLGGLSMGRWSVRTSLASREPGGDSQVAHPAEASERGPEVGGGDGVLRDVCRRTAASVGRQPDRGPAGRWQGGARLCGGLRRGAVATRWQRRSGGGRAGGLGQGHAMGVPASRSLGAGTGVLGGVDGGPPADADDLAGAIGGALARVIGRKRLRC